MMPTRRNTIIHRLRKQGAARIIAEVTPALQAAGDKVAAYAAHSITQGSVSGKNHVPSAPGTAPNEDTAHLRSQISVTQPEPLRVQVRSDAKYSVPLEFGTSKMAARPFMRPAAEANRKVAQKLVSAAVKSALKSLES